MAATTSNPGTTSVTFNRDRPGVGRRVSVLGVPLGYGCSMAGVDLGPAALRVARLNQRLAQLGYEVRDLGDLRIQIPRVQPEVESIPHYLSEITAVCEELARDAKSILSAGEIPLFLGGDHSIAIGSFSGVSSFYREKNLPVGLLWFDAHADMNIPETSPSGNIHGMPLAVLLGYGARELVSIEYEGPKVAPEYCVHIGARDLDQGEKDLIRSLGIRFFTMRDIDERGIGSCMDEALAIVSQAPGGYSVTFDVDALDPSDAPGSGTLVRGGLTFREAHLALEKVADNGGMRSFEIVEINTALDTNNRTAELGVELILSALGKSIL